MTAAAAAVVNRIDVRGNQRVDAETIQGYLTIRPGASFSAEDIDESAAAETVLDSVTQAPELAQQQLDAAREGHEQALEAQHEASEGGRAGSSASAGD